MNLVTFIRNATMSLDMNVIGAFNVEISARKRNR